MGAPGQKKFLTNQQRCDILVAQKGSAYNMKEKLAKVFEIEFHYTEVGFKNEPDRQKRAEMIWYARQRGLGAVTLAQMCGLSYEDAEQMFNEYCWRLGGLENEVR